MLRNMINYLNRCSKEINDYTHRLPNANLNEVLDVVLPIWENRELGVIRREWGTFQIFHKHSNPCFGQEAASELELKVNDYLKENSFPLAISIQQICVCLPPFPFRVPTQTYEVVIFDNSISEAQDPLIDWIIENRAELN